MLSGAEEPRELAAPVSAGRLVPLYASRAIKVDEGIGAAAEGALL